MLIIAPGNIMVLNDLVQNLYNTDDIIVYNLCSFNESIERVDIVPPLDILKMGNVYDIDGIVYNYIFNNTDNLFYEFFTKIILPLYMQKNVILLANAEYDFYDIYIESLLKIIQDRYGISAVIINDPEDIDEINKNILFGRESGFSINGLMNLDIDKERYSNIVSSIQNLEVYNGI